MADKPVFPYFGKNNHKIRNKAVSNIYTYGEVSHEEAKYTGNRAL